MASIESTTLPVPREGASAGRAERRKRRTADALFALQLVCTAVFGVTQFARMLVTTQGVNVSLFVFLLLFILINLTLALRAHRVQPSRVTFQTIGSYAAWAVVLVPNIALMVVKQSSTWGPIDTWTSILVAAGGLATFVYARRRGLGLTDPIVRGLSALSFKAMPQLTLAVNVYLVGGAGLALGAIVTGHVTICTRLGQLFFSLKEAGWDRNRVGMAISEVGNEATWLLLTIVWLLP